MVLNFRAVAYTLGILVLFLGVALLIPMGVALYYGEPTWWAFGVTALGAMIFGGLAWGLRDKAEAELQIREGFAIVALAWVILSAVGAIPFLLADVVSSYGDAFFETMSAFSTTGATILGGGGNPNIEDIPKAFLFVLAIPGSLVGRDGNYCSHAGHSAPSRSGRDAALQSRGARTIRG